MFLALYDRKNMNQINLSNYTLVYGDYYLACNAILNFKMAFQDVNVIVLSLDEKTFDDVRCEMESNDFDQSDKVVIIKDLPNKKDCREFLLDIISRDYDNVKLLLWDSLCHIKVDKKIGGINKTWMDFVSKFKNRNGAKLAYYGESFTEKDKSACVKLVVDSLAMNQKIISGGDALTLVEIVGYDRGLLISEIDKLVINSPEVLTHEFIIENVYPTSKESLLYKISNALDNYGYNECIETIERFIDSGINWNVIAEIFVKRSRWHMLIIYWWYKGMPLSKVSDLLIGMGQNTTSEEMKLYLKSECHYADRLFNVDGKEFKKEAIPMQFMAEQMVEFVKRKIIGDKDRIQVLLKNAIKTYLSILERQAKIRYGENPEQNIREMLRLIFSSVRG